MHLQLLNLDHISDDRGTGLISFRRWPFSEVMESRKAFSHINEERNESDSIWMALAMTEWWLFLTPSPFSPFFPLSSFLFPLSSFSSLCPPPPIPPEDCLRKWIVSSTGSWLSRLLNGRRPQKRKASDRNTWTWEDGFLAWSRIEESLPACEISHGIRNQIEGSMDMRSILDRSGWFRLIPAGSRWFPLVPANSGWFQGPANAFLGGKEW